MSAEMDSRYDHTTSEKEIAALWEASGFTNPDNLPLPTSNPEPQAFSIIMPPPNANGHLHAGHAMFVTVEDIMIRYARMQGKRTLWLPGADHAGFETQVVYEKKLEKEGRSRFQMTPEELRSEIMAFTLENKKHMEAELRSLGASCDWSRERFTLDPVVVKTVYQTFKKLFDEGLAYRGAKIISWCPKHQTSFSDLEIEDVEKTDSFYYLQYGPFVIATSRPETKFGDKYVVMHPDDKRYAQYADGQKIELEWINGPTTATIIKDSAIDMNFGTGVMTITPWHDTADFEIAERHGLDKEQVIDERGKLLALAGEFAGMKIDEARPKIIEKLKEKGLLVRTDENYKHVVRTCYKCGTTIEPQIKTQWFVKTKPLAARAVEAIEKGDVVFVPEHYKKICLHWLENIIDWNVSRQIAWGIPIPAKICTKCGKGMVDLENTLTTCACGGEMRQDTDTFDTWFSSGQWPFITLGYPITQKMGFNEALVDSVKQKKKYLTYRLHDKNFHVGETVIAENTQTEQPFGFIRIKNITKQKIKDIPCPQEGNETYQNATELIQVQKTYYPNENITEETEMYVYEFAYTERSDFEQYYPTTIMETAGEIIFFWVTRMIMFGLYVTGEVPFRTVYLHGLVLDAKGRKMSKSKGNVINPLEITEKYGTDALRMALIVGNTPGTSLSLAEDRVRGYRNFATKIWNAARFVMMNQKTIEVGSSTIEEQLADEDRAFIAEAQQIKKEVGNHIEQFELHLAAEKAYHYFWHTFADKIIEHYKPSFPHTSQKMVGVGSSADAAMRSSEHGSSQSDESEIASPTHGLAGDVSGSQHLNLPSPHIASYVLTAILKDCLIMLHPFVPFVTEAIWQKVYPKKILMIETWE